MSTLTAVFKDRDDAWNTAQVTAVGATITDTIDRLIGMGFSADCPWEMTLTLFSATSARRLSREQMITAASEAEAARKATVVLNGWAS